jgi:hypothetical protein
MLPPGGRVPFVRLAIHANRAACPEHLACYHRSLLLITSERNRCTKVQITTMPS